MKKKRQDLSGNDTPLGADLFNSLRRVEYPDSAESAELAKAAVKAPPAASKPAALNFHVARTRKGGLPIALEKRPGGKTVTVVRNVSGDSEAMLSWLKKKCGAGGVVREGTIELQGDLVQRLAPMLSDFLK